jgi:hypothetical protein
MARIQDVIAFFRNNDAGHGQNGTPCGLQPSVSETLANRRRRFRIPSGGRIEMDTSSSKAVSNETL